MTPHLPSLHVGASLYLCTQRRGQGSHCNPSVIWGTLGSHWLLTCSDGDPLLFLPSAQRARALGFQRRVFHRDPAELG